MTPTLHLSVLASGSKGNAAVVEGPRGSLLIDCGLSWRELTRRAESAGVELRKVTAAILTHEHGDHCSGLGVVRRNLSCELITTAGTAAASRRLLDVPFSLVRHDEAFEVCGMRVELFPTSHDVSDPVGLRLSVANEGDEPQDALGWCTDTGFLTAEALGALRGCRILGIEANHDTSMLAHGPYPSFLKSRVGGETGHLSNAQCAAALPQLVGEGTETVVALHLSQKNNTPGACIRELSEALGAQPLGPQEVSAGSLAEARGRDGSLTICVAGQDEPLVVW
ncbi:MBL fold metallo-hydrolase [Olsenella sp. HMSC062G07]|uniref:MBL fold metallo-hydrolase n=1 Tax=Olsenella sp. HMSC062G07 TaxID=1739330 RepID=UPI0008A1E815|nr:MBL fold metallo-hydrolase [Olsenella sp. HMSC062G07]OFK25288.1 MBL fold metallo-hydrolase [Olsenella sp. HMSC062G07]